MRQSEGLHQRAVRRHVVGKVALEPKQGEQEPAQRRAPDLDSARARGAQQRRQSGAGEIGVVLVEEDGCVALLQEGFGVRHHEGHPASRGDVTASRLDQRRRLGQMFQH